MLRVGQQNEDLDSCGDGGTDMEIRRIQAGANAWKKVEGVMGDRHISDAKRKGA